MFGLSDKLKIKTLKENLASINAKLKNNSKYNTKTKNKHAIKFKTLYSFHIRPDSYKKQYHIDDATVTISNNFQYMIFEPQFRSTHGREAYEKIMGYRKLYGGGTKVTLNDLLYTVEKTAKDLSLLSEFNDNYRQFRYYIKRNILGYDVLDVMLHDDLLEDVTCSDYTQSVGVIHGNYLDRHTLRSNVFFDGKNHMLSFMERMANKANKHLSAATPIVDAQVDTWYRMSLISDDIISPKSPAISIRIKSKNPLTFYQFFNYSTISPEIIAVIWAFLDVRGTGLIIGGTGSGKTSILNALLCLLRESAKIITIEDTAEMISPQVDWLPLIVDAPAESSEYFKKFELLLNAALRQRPYMISIGEVRGATTRMLFNAISTGHSSLSSFHAYTAAGAINRIIGEMNVHPGSFASLWFILTMGEIITKNKRLERRCISFDEVYYDGDKVSLINLVHYDASMDSFVDGTIHEMIQKSKRLKLISKMDATSDIINDLSIRVDLLKECTKQQAKTPQAILGVLSKYYEKKYQ